MTPAIPMTSAAPGIAITPMEPFGVCVQAEREGQDLLEVSVSYLRELAREHHMVLLRGFAPIPSAAGLTSYCEAWGEIMLWPFGAVLELVEADKPTDHIFDSSYVPLHWDGMYKPLIPEFQIFQCVSSPGASNGGRTTFSDTTRLLREMDAERRARWEKINVTYRIQNVVHYGGKAVSPLVVPHPVTAAPVLRYNEPPIENDDAFLNKPHHEWEGIAPEEAPALMRELKEALYDPRYYYAHEWREGDLLISDNYTLLHGRESFTSRCPRHLRRVHVLGEPPFKNPAIG